MQTPAEELYWFIRNEIDAEDGELELTTPEAHHKPYEGHVRAIDTEGRERTFRLLITEL